MPSIGPITIPAAIAAAAFPLIPAFGSTQVIAPQVVVHRMGAANGKRVQIMRGPNLRRFVAQFNPIGKTAHDGLLAWFETAQGALANFDFTHRAKDGNVTTKVRLADSSLSIDLLKGWRSRPVSLAFLEVQSATPTYTVTQTLDRFPNSGLNTALLQQVQEIIPLVRIRVADVAIDDIHLSDRLCVIGGTRYEPRILDWGGIGQQTGERSDQASFSLGNADDVFTQLIESVDLSFARVEFGFYHVQTQTKVDLWVGHLSEDGAWSLRDDSASVELRVSDGLAATTAVYPVRAIVPTCGKELNGPLCPVSVAGTNAGTPCDKGFETPTGCKFHSMERYFGGVVVKQQLVQLRADTSFFGPRASTLSASSVINEAATNRPLKEVYTDIDMPVPCDILAGRDESEFKAGLGVVGAGPIGAFSSDLTLQTLDGVGPHGGNTGLGFRFISGVDPANANDQMGLTEAKYSWGAPPDTPYAAGVAAIEVRRTDQKGIQGFRPSDWQMSASVAQGVGGWKWTAVGTRVWVSGLTNPVWIAVNGWLKENGVWCDNAHPSAIDVALMEQLVDVDACISAAAICDASVATLVGSGSETQFKFCGIVGEFRPFRQWLSIFLDGALCDYTFRTGKLRITARVNASAASAFGPGNVVFRSLRSEMRAPRFNHLTVEFGDQEYKFERNGVNLYDEDHGKRRAPNGGMPVYTKQAMNPAGVTRKSQASRLAITLLREELGGFTAAEQRASRNVSWRTTILALEVEPGMVVSLNGFSRIPNGTKVRINGWTINPDFSITLAGSTVTSSMYDYAIGPKPEDVSYGPPDIERAPAVRDRRWFPNQAAPDADDPTLDENDLSFHAGIAYQGYADGSKRAVLQLEGKPHVNSTLAADLPQLRTISFVPTGGALIGTKPLYLCVAPYDAGGRVGPRSRTIAVHLDAATMTCAAALSNITWPSGTWTGWKLYAANEERAMCLQGTFVGVLPSSLNFAGPLKRSTEGPPEAGDRGYLLRAKELLVPGAMKALVTSLPTTSKVICSALAGTSADFTGETLMVIGDASEGFPALRTWSITAFNAGTGEFTLERTHAGTDPLQAGDTVVVLARATSSTSTTISCSHLAMATDEYANALVRVAYGQGAGQLRRIVSNDSTTLTIDSPWDAAPASTAFFVVEPANWQYEAPLDTPNIAQADQSVILQVPVENLVGRTLLAMGFLVDGAGNTGSEDIAPFRLVEVVGAEGVAPGNDPPGLIRDPEIVSIDVESDPGFLLVSVGFKAPLVLNNFDHVIGWLVVPGLEPIGVGEISHPKGSAADGSGTFRIGRPTGATWVAPKLFLASASETYRNSLVTEVGAGQTPNVTLDDIEAYLLGAPAAPTAPTACTISVIPGGDNNFSLLTGWTPADPIGGTTRWRRQVKYYNDEDLTLPDHDDWIDLGEIYQSDEATSAQTPFWPRPPADQWVKHRVCGMNQADIASDWVESATAAKVDASDGGVAAPPETPGSCAISIVPKGATFGFQILIVPPDPLGGTAGYDREVKYYNDEDLTVEDHDDWIPLGWVDHTGTTSLTAYWSYPNYPQWVRVRVRGSNWVGGKTEWVYSTVAAVLESRWTSPQANITGITAVPFPNGEKGWGVDWAVSLPVDRSLFKRLALGIVQVGSGASGLMAGPIVPLSGLLAGSTDGLYPRPLADEEYYIESDAEDVYGNRLPPVQSAPFTIGPFAWEDVSFGSPTLDYAAVQANVQVTVGITAPTDPEITAVQLWQKRGSEAPREVMRLPISSAGTISAKFPIELPVGSAASVDIYGVPVHGSGASEGLRTGGGSPHPKITISANPALQTPVSSYEGFDRYILTSSGGTINKSPSAGKTYLLLLAQDGTGGRTVNFNGAHFQGNIPQPWQDPNSITSYQFIGDDFGSGVIWQLVSTLH